MDKINTLPPIIPCYINRRIVEICKKTGNVCNKWVDDDIIEDLYALDKEDGGNRVNEYRMSCHEPHAIFKIDTGKCTIHCSPIQINKAETCCYNNEEASNLFSKEFFSPWGKDA